MVLGHRPADKPRLRAIARAIALGHDPAFVQHQHCACLARRRIAEQGVYRACQSLARNAGFGNHGRQGLMAQRWLAGRGLRAADQGWQHQQRHDRGQAARHGAVHAQGEFRWQLQSPPFTRPQPKSPAHVQVQPPRRRGRKIALVIVLALVAGLIFAWAPLNGFAVTGASYGARVACSCHFVGGRSLKDCRKDFEPGMELVMLSEDRAQRTVTARFPLLSTQTATFREGQGCVLEKWRD